MLATSSVTQIDTVVARLDGWFETMRCAGGYGGPVAHWWQQSLVYTGPGLDWRYEGIIAGYLNLWERTGEERWLQKACRAGDDLLAGQLENGHFAASAFEINPASAGTPHEAACDVGLLLLALALKKDGFATWQQYAACAERNLKAFYLDQLWDTSAQSFRDSPTVPSFVPNKAATAAEAFFLLSEVTGDSMWAEKYALPNLDRIIAHQIHSPGSKLDGAVAQNSFGTHKVEKYFPIYNARCISALLRGYRWTNREGYLDSASRIMHFIKRWSYEDGSFPTVIYANQQVNRYPSWVAPLGDILRAAQELESYGFSADFSITVNRLLAGQDASGGIQTATGFAAQAGSSPRLLPDVRDVLHVAGWCDKAFRYLTTQALTISPTNEPGNFEIACTFQGNDFKLVETPEVLEITNPKGHVFYKWNKGQPWAEVAAPEFWIK